MPPSFVRKMAIMPKQYPSEVRDRVVRMTLDRLSEYPSVFAAWRAIATGYTSEVAATSVGVSQAAGTRWFRDRGGMPTFMVAPLKGRYLSFEEREVIALLNARGTGVREIARALKGDPSTISRELRRNAATRAGKLDYRAAVRRQAQLLRRFPRRCSCLACHDCWGC
jgi:hypothetical protein